MARQTRITLIQRLRDQQDEKSWAEFAAAYHGYIRAVLNRMGLKWQDVDDLSQEVLLKVWKALPKFEYQQGKCRFHSWIIVICRNEANRHFGRGGQEGEPSTAGEWVATTEPELEEIAEEEWRDHVSAQAWENIRPQFSEGVQQCFLLAAQGLDAAVIAARTGLAERSVRANRQRVTAALYREIVRIDNELG
jgi:RNA polymerase sigma factor (sigma-70 family)